MKQSRFASLVESLVNIAVGLALSIVLQDLVLARMLGIAMPLSVNFAFAGVMTAASIARSFALRRLFEALNIRVPLSPFVLAVIAERRRQVEVEGWTAEHDDGHEVGELAHAGAGYAFQAEIWAKYPGSAMLSPPFAPAWWPWEREWWKPTGFRRDLVKAAALILAEGEKFDRSKSRRPS